MKWIDVEKFKPENYDDACFDKDLYWLFMKENNVSKVSNGPEYVSCSDCIAGKNDEPTDEPSIEEPPPFADHKLYYSRKDGSAFLVYFPYKYDLNKLSEDIAWGQKRFMDVIPRGEECSWYGRGTSIVAISRCHAGIEFKFNNRKDSNKASQ